MFRMNCRTYRGELLEAARGDALSREAKIHIDGCASCSRFFEEQIALSAAYAAVEEQAPPEIESSLLAEFDWVRRKRKLARLGAASLLLAAGVAAVMLLPKKPAATPGAPAPIASSAHETVRPPTPASVPSKAPARPRGATKRRAVSVPETPFLQIPYTLPLQPYERASVVRMEMPVAALISAGLPIQTANTGAQAQADVVIGEDGRARAVRLISIAGN
jgi:hypothetical protein